MASQLTPSGHLKRIITTGMLAAGSLTPWVGAQTAPPASPEAKPSSPALGTDVPLREPPPASPSEFLRRSQSEEPTPTATDVRGLLIQTVDSIVSPNEQTPVNAQVASSDAQIVQNLVDSTTLRETVKQLQAAYKEKYGHEFDVATASDNLFPESSFRIGIAMALVRPSAGATQPTDGAASTAEAVSPTAGDEQARTASATDRPAEAGSDLATESAYPSNGASTNAGETDDSAVDDRTISAAASPDKIAIHVEAPELTRRISVTIPESEGVPETSLKLTNEEGLWKLDIPEGTSAQAFEQSLQKQLQQAMNQAWPEDSALASQLIARHALLAFASEGSTGQIGNAQAPQPRDSNEPAPATPVPTQAGTAQPAAPENAEGAQPPSDRPTYSERREAERAAREARRESQKPGRDEQSPDNGSAGQAPADSTPPPAPSNQPPAPAPVPSPSQ